MDINKGAKNKMERENELAQRYYDFVNESLRSKIADYLQTMDIERSVIVKRINEIQNLYTRMVDIQYEISQISPRETILSFFNNSNIEEKVYAYAIDEQAKNWLDRLSSALNILTIKASEFNIKDAKRREKYILLFSVIISAIIGGFITWFFDKDDDLINQTKEITRYQDSIINELDKDNNLHFDTITTQYYQQFKNDSIINCKLDISIKQNSNIIRNQNRLIKRVKD
jgi:hypothetical protein